MDIDALEEAIKAIVRLNGGRAHVGNVVFSIPKRGPDKGKLVHDIPTECWNVPHISDDIKLKSSDAMALLSAVQKMCATALVSA